MTRKLDFSDVGLYAVTPEVTDPEATLRTIDLLLEGGVDAVQLRCRGLSDRSALDLAKRIRERCAASDALFLMNNRLDLAIAAEADGVHIGHEDLPAGFVREMIGHRKILGVSTHAVPEGLDAQRNGADYVSCGPVWATPTKPAYPAVGLGLIGLYRAAMRVPFVVIGGVNRDNIDQVVKTGATCVAVVRGLFEAAEPAAAARFFKEKINLNRTTAGTEAKS